VLFFSSTNYFAVLLDQDKDRDSCIFDFNDRRGLKTDKAKGVPVRQCKKRLDAQKSTEEGRDFSRAF
jgi:hypothetical protein